MDTVVVNGCAQGGIATVSVGASPFTFVNPESVRVVVCISGGTVTTISMSPDGINFMALGLLGGQFILNPGHSLQVVYILAPTIKYTPI